VIDERSLLVVEDDERFAETLATEFSDRGYSVESVGSLAEVKCSEAARFSYALVDLRLRNDSGLDVISYLKECSPEMRIIVLTGYGSIATAVKATKLGATSYFTKPVDIDEVERAFHSDAEEEEDIIPIPDEFPSLYRHEREYIEYVLAECDGNISQAARRLGLHRQSLQRKLRKFSPN